MPEGSSSQGPRMFDGPHPDGRSAQKAKSRSVVGRKWLKYFEVSRDYPEIAEPNQGRVDGFLELLNRAVQGTPDMYGPPLQLTPEEFADLRMLHRFRGDIEHVKPKVLDTSSGRTT